MWMEVEEVGACMYALGSHYEGYEQCSQVHTHTSLNFYLHWPCNAPPPPKKHRWCHFPEGQCPNKYLVIDALVVESYPGVSKHCLEEHVGTPFGHPVSKGGIE